MPVLSCTFGYLKATTNIDVTELQEFDQFVFLVNRGKSYKTLLLGFVTVR